MPLRFQNVCRHRQTNNTSRLPPILTPHTLFSHFPAPLLSNFPAFPENLLPAVFRRSSHRTRCFLTFLPRLFQTFPPFPKISCRPSSADPHTAHVVFSLSCPASFKLSRLSRKSPAGRLPPILTLHTLFSHFPAPLLSNFPAFPENLLPAVFRRSSHRTRCFLTFPVLFTAPLPDVFVSSF